MVPESTYGKIIEGAQALFAEFKEKLASRLSKAEGGVLEIMIRGHLYAANEIGSLPTATRGIYSQLTRMRVQSHSNEKIILREGSVKVRETVFAWSGFGDPYFDSLFVVVLAVRFNLINAETGRGLIETAASFPKAAETAPESNTAFWL